ncbi:hypothetical protein [Bacteroides sp.]
MKRLLLILLLQSLYIAATFAQVTFKPTSATIKDSQGTYTSNQFDCGNMVVTDNGNSIQISLAGDKMILYPTLNNSDTYTSTIQQGNITIKTVAFRSSNLHNIYLVTITSKKENGTITIYFKP